MISIVSLDGMFIGAIATGKEYEEPFIFHPRVGFVREKELQTDLLSRKTRGLETGDPSGLISKFKIQVNGQAQELVVADTRNASATRICKNKWLLSTVSGNFQLFQSAHRDSYFPVKEPKQEFISKTGFFISALVWISMVLAWKG